MRQRRVGGVLAALCVAAGSSGVLAIGLLAPASGRVHTAGGSGAPTRSGWPIAAAFSSPGGVGWIAADPNSSMVTGNGLAAAPPPPAPPSSPAPAATPTPAPTSGTATASFASNTSGFPVAGEATGYGCAAAFKYLSTYAAPGFWVVCPGYARGHQAETACQSGPSQCSILRMIVIADPCPNAYMNEASNSWALMGESDAPLDPYGSCG